MGPSFTRVPIVVSLFLVFAIAGCIGGDETTPGDQGGQDEDDSKPSDTQGVITGQIMDARDFSPIKGVQVAIVQDQQAVEELETGTNGEYTTGPLEPGLYRVQTSSTRFKGDFQAVQVESGKTATLNMVLEALPTEKPWSEPLEFDGLMGLGYHGVGPIVTCCQADENHKISFKFEVRPDLLETMVIEMVWPEEHVGLLMNVWLEPNCDPTCAPEHDYTEQSEDDNLGWGGLEMRIDRPEGGWPEISGNEPVELWIYVWTDSGDEPATVAYQQQFEIFMENFYVTSAPQGYSPRGDY